MKASTRQPEIVLRGRYFLKEDLGKKNGNAIYLAWDQLFHRQVLIQESFCEEKREKESFLELGEKLIRLDGTPGLLNVFAVFEANGHVYRIWEYPGGITLETVVKKYGALEFDDVQWMLEEYSRCLSYAHGIGVYHEQIAPDCCYMTSIGELKLGGFGAGVQQDSTVGIMEDVKGLAWLAVYMLTGGESLDQYEPEKIGKILQSRCTENAYETLLQSIMPDTEKVPVSMRRFIDLFHGDATIELTE